MHEDYLPTPLSLFLSLLVPRGYSLYTVQNQPNRLSSYSRGTSGLRRAFEALVRTDLGQINQSSLISESSSTGYKWGRHNSIGREVTPNIGLTYLYTIAAE